MSSPFVRQVGAAAVSVLSGNLTPIQAALCALGRQEWVARHKGE